MDCVLEVPVICLELAVFQDHVHKPRIGLGHQRIERAHQFLGVGEMLPEEMQYEVARYPVVVGIHGHLPEEIDDAGMLGGYGGYSVPEIVEREEGLGAGFRTLVFGSTSGIGSFVRGLLHSITETGIPFKKQIMSG